jgi:hypothetical protein
MRKSLLILFCVVSYTVISCGDKNSVPSHIIPREKMEKILWDMILADQYSTYYLAKDSAKINVKKETLKLYQQVFQLQQVSFDEFRKSYKYYIDHPSLSKTLFDSLVARGNRQRTESFDPSKKPID